MKTQCIAPNEIEDWELEAYVDGEADDRVRAHVEKCPYCAAQARARRRWQLNLTRRLYRFDCPSTNELLDFCWHDLSAPEARRVSAHLETCGHCRAEVAALRQVIVEEETKEAPNESWEQVKDTLRAIKVTVAHLLSPAPALAPALRGLPRGGLYRAGDVDVSITFTGPDDKGEHVLDGQILAPRPEEWVGATARLLDDTGAGYARSEIDEVGGFAFTRLPAGRWEVKLSNEWEEIDIPRIEV